MSGGMWTFNVQDGFAEAIVRGDRAALLTPEDYRKLMVAESLEDLRSCLEDTDYGSFLQDEPSPLTVATIGMRCRERLAEQFRNIQAQANSELSLFLRYIVAERMIDTVVSLIQGALNRKNVPELLSRIDPLGWSNDMKALLTIDITAGYDELYRTVLIETPVGHYFQDYLEQQSQDLKQMSQMEGVLSELDLEIMRASLKRSWLEDFYSYCVKLGGTTGDIMGHILKRQADLLVLSVSLNSLNSPMGGSSHLLDKSALFPSFGYFYPSTTDALRKAYNDQLIRQALENQSPYIEIYEQCKAYYLQDQGAHLNNDPSLDQSSTEIGNTANANQEGKATERSVPQKKLDQDQLSLEDAVYRHEVKMYEFAFEQQMHYAIFYAWIKLKEQEIRNILWIADMILMQRRDNIDAAVLPIFAPRY